MKTPTQELIDTLKELQETQDPHTLRDAIEFFVLLHGPFLNAEDQRLDEILLDCATTIKTKRNENTNARNEM
jgi:hypothetical protein